MRFKIFTIEFNEEKACFFEEELDNFAISHNILSTKSEFINKNGKYYWTIMVEYELREGLRKDKTTEINLNDSEQKLLESLKLWRTDKAKELGYPTYIILTNALLVEITKEKPQSISSLKIIKGIGDSKAKKYGDDIINIIKSYLQNDEELDMGE